MLIKGNNRLKGNIRSILLIQLGDIGDVVLSFPSMRVLRASYPKAKFVVAVREKAKELVEDCPWATEVVAINEGKMRWYQEVAYQIDFFARLRKYKFDLAIDMRTGTRGAILAFLSGAYQRIGFYAHEETFWRNRLFTHLAYLKGKPGQHMSEYYLDFFDAYNINTDTIQAGYEIPQEKKQSVEVLFRKEKIPSGRSMIALQPFSLWKYKEWGTDKYIKLIDWLDKEYDLPVIITGSLAERDDAEKIIRVCGNKVYNLAGKTSIGMLAAVLKTCSLFIGGDSAGIHIAAALDIPTVCIFGPSSADVWAPRGEDHCIVQKKLPCVPCNLKGCEGSGISRCLEELSFEEVKEKIAGRINRLI